MLAADLREVGAGGHKSPTPPGRNRIAALVGFRTRGADPIHRLRRGVLVRSTAAGTLEGGWPLIPGTLMFRRSGEHLALAPARPDSPDFRCGHCGGPLLVDEFDIVMVRSEKLEEIEDRPRRGRPPKRPR